MPSTAASSQYGSDFGDEDELAELNAQVLALEAQCSIAPASASAAPDALVLENIHEHGRPAVVKVPNSSQQRHHTTNSNQDPAWTDSQTPGSGLALGAYPAEPSGFGIRPEACAQVSRDDSAGRIVFEATELGDPAAPDSRTPLQRFRTAPKKPLSVTDLVSPAWCELQYWYTLTKHGKKRQTPAMKQGSAVHKTLEDQVHETVPIDAKTREDFWGLKIWNIIQGLRTLKATGLTRELEIWSLIDGQVVNGVIDELSFTCSDPAMEAAIAKLESRGASHKQPELPANQTTMADFFAAKNTSSPRAATLESRLKSSTKREDGITLRKAYITDVKTRLHSSIPKAHALRPTFMQLMLYRQMLGDLASGAVDPLALFTRYGLNAEVPFSDALISQLASLDFFPNSIPAENDPSSAAPLTSDSLTELLAHNSLIELWSLMLQEFQQVLPRGKDSLSKVLKVEFRAQTDASIIGTRTFPHKDDELQRYVADKMGWWKGDRDARGVEVEEAYKCASCEFADGCTWRLDKVEAALRESRETRARSTAP